MAFSRIQDMQRSMSTFTSNVGDAIARNGYRDAERLHGLEINLVTQWLAGNRKHYGADLDEYDGLIDYSKRIQSLYDAATTATDFYIVVDMLHGLSNRIRYFPTKATDDD